MPTQNRSQSRNFPRAFPLRPGAIPPELGRLTNLKELILGGNALSGTFADSLPICVCAVIRRHYESMRAGAIPESIGNLTNLTDLQLQYNKLEGELLVLPVIRRSHTNKLMHRSCTGELPLELIRMKAKGCTMELSGNKGFTLPSNIGELGDDITELNLWNCSLQGLCITSSTQELISPRAGAIPASIGNLINLQELRLFNNSLTGA